MICIQIVCCFLLTATFIPLSLGLENQHKVLTKSHLILEYNWPKVAKGLKRIPHIESCDHFYVTRSDGRHDIKKCPDGQSFDFHTLVCKEKSQAYCWSEKFRSTTAKKQFVCPFPWGLYPDIKECSRYFSCLNGKPSHKRCPGSTLFDKVSRKCGNDSEATCADEKDIVEPGYKCPYNWGFFTYPKDCSKYYECLQKNPSLRTCKKNNLFDNLKRKCLPKHRVNCGARFNPYAFKSSSFKQETTDLISSTVFDLFSTYSQTTHMNDNPNGKQSTQHPSKFSSQSTVNLHSTAIIIDNNNELSHLIKSTHNEDSPNQSTSSKKEEFSPQPIVNLHSTPAVITTGNDKELSHLIKSAQNEGNLNQSASHKKDGFSLQPTVNLHPTAIIRDNNDELSPLIKSTQNEENQSKKKEFSTEIHSTVGIKPLNNDNLNEYIQNEDNLSKKDEPPAQLQEKEMHSTVISKGTKVSADVKLHKNEQIKNEGNAIQKKISKTDELLLQPTVTDFISSVISVNSEANTNSTSHDEHIRNEEIPTQRK